MSILLALIDFDTNTIGGFSTTRQEALCTPWVGLALAVRSYWTVFANVGDYALVKRNIPSKKETQFIPSDRPSVRAEQRAMTTIMLGLLNAKRTSFLCSFIKCKFIDTFSYRTNHHIQQTCLL